MEGLFCFFLSPASHPAVTANCSYIFHVHTVTAAALFPGPAERPLAFNMVEEKPVLNLPVNPVPFRVQILAFLLHLLDEHYNVAYIVLSVQTVVALHASIQ